MDILFLLIPLSAALVLAIVAVFGWAVHAGQFDDLEIEGERILAGDDASTTPPPVIGPRGGPAAVTRSGFDDGQVDRDARGEQLPP